jgi:hypothetical protein
VRVDPACSDFQHGTREDPSGEYVCLRSYDQRSISLAGWRLEDAAHHRYVFPLFVLAPGEKVKVHSGQGQNTQTDLYTGSNLIWNNDGDTVFLYDALGRLITSYSY